LLLKPVPKPFKAGLLTLRSWPCHSDWSHFGSGEWRSSGGDVVRMLTSLTVGWRAAHTNTAPAHPRAVKGLAIALLAPTALTT
jgi:hypothetical protein